MSATIRLFEQIRIRHAALGLVLVLATSCGSLGPKTIPRDQFDYGKAISDAWKQQLLINIVGMRYVEAPVFVNVSSVINQYSLEGEVSVGGGINTSFADNDTFRVGGAARYADRPTITYIPITGHEFSRSLLTPIPPQAIFALVQSGWSPEVIFRLSVRAMNGVDNEWASPSQRRQADPRFTKMLGIWRRLRRDRILGLRREQKDGEAKIIVYQKGEMATGELAADLRFLQEALDLDPEVHNYHLLYGLVPDKKNQIAVLTSSLLEIINELAWRIDVPPEHIEEGRTGPTFRDDDPDATPLIRVHYSEDKPDDTYVAVKVRDYWFYVDDRDVVSKRTFAMVQIILSLTDSGDASKGPVVTITN